MIRAVVDTNVYVSALVFGGKPAAVLQLAESGAFQLVASAEIRAELVETLTEKFGWPNDRAERCERLKEAVTEIQKVARVDPVTAADGVVSLMEKIWPAFQHVDTSSGALGGAVNWAQSELLPIVIEAPVDRKTRDKWLDRLWQAIQEDGVDYLWMVQDRWGGLCGSPQTASSWADKFLGLLRAAWSDPRPGNYVLGTSICLSSSVAAGRHQELLEVLALHRFPLWCNGPRFSPS